VRKELALAGALVLVVVGAAFVLPEVSEARPAYEIPVRDAGSADNFENATAQGWSRTPSATVPLGTTGSAVPNADEISVESVEVEAARADGRLFVRLSWADGTRDDSTGAIRSFADAAALQFPVSEESRPPLAMGSTDNRVNVWYWNGAGANEEILAGGPGTITSFDQPATNTAATYEDGQWHVVFSRPLDLDGANRTTISNGQNLDVAVAVWNGSTLERSGQKGASEWYYLATGPGPEGPPYETILWVVAGIAIVLTTLVTIEGVRRTRGE
jgi:DMSO reductase family type II enzyme heme b subunit